LFVAEVCLSSRFGFLFRPVQVIVSHQLHQLVETDFWFPAEFAASLARVDHFSGAKVFDTIANLRRLGKPPANDKLVGPTGVPTSVGLCLVKKEPN